jgi:hypothetical protein
MIDGLEVTSQFKSDHIVNLLMEVEGKFPEDKAKCLDIIQRYFALADEERLNFQLGRRMGLYETLSDMGEPGRHARVASTIRVVRERGDDVDEVMRRLKDRFI